MNNEWGKIQIGANIRAKFKILRKMEPGGGGPVYSGIDTQSKEIIHIRFLSRAAFADEAAFGQRMEEAKKARDLCGEIIMLPIDWGFHEEHPYTVYRIGNVKRLEQFLQSGRKLDEKAVRSFVEPLLKMLMACHEAGLCHLGLSPLSVCLVGGALFNMEPRVLEFSLAPRNGHSYYTFPASAETKFVSVAAYMSPEQAGESDTVDFRSDLYSLGCLIYRVIVGKAPVEGGSSQEIMDKVLKEMPRALEDDSSGIPAGAKDFLTRALQKDPAERFQSASEMMESFYGSMGEKPGKPAPRPKTPVAPVDAAKPKDRIALPEKLASEDVLEPSPEEAAAAPQDEMKPPIEEAVTALDRKESPLKEAMRELDRKEPPPKEPTTGLERKKPSLKEAMAAFDRKKPPPFRESVAKAQEKKLHLAEAVAAPQEKKLHPAEAVVALEKKKHPPKEAPAAPEQKKPSAEVAKSDEVLPVKPVEELPAPGAAAEIEVIETPEAEVTDLPSVVFDREEEEEEKEVKKRGGRKGVWITLIVLLLASCGAFYYYYIHEGNLFRPDGSMKTVSELFDFGQKGPESGVASVDASAAGAETTDLSSLASLDGAGAMDPAPSEADEAADPALADGDDAADPSPAEDAEPAASEMTTPPEPEEVAAPPAEKPVEGKAEKKKAGKKKKKKKGKGKVEKGPSSIIYVD